MAALDIPGLRKAVAENRYFITAHAKQRMGVRRVSDLDLKHVERLLVTHAAKCAECGGTLTEQTVTYTGYYATVATSANCENT